MVFTLPRHRAPVGQDDSTWIEINYSYSLGYTWIECGISRVNNFLSALGFNSSQQVAAMCAKNNIFSLFAADDWIRNFVNAEDKRLIYGEPLKIAVNFFPNFASAANPILRNGSQNPNYSDFFQLIFTYLTHGQNAADRQRFIEWWSFQNGINTDPKFAYVGNTTPRNLQKTLQNSASVLVNFKNAVDEFLKRPDNINGTVVASSYLPAGVVPSSGMIPYAVGQASVVRIPIPNTNGLCIEFKPRGWTPKGGSTSMLFFQDISGKKHLRLDYGFNKNTKTVNYHWNQKGTYDIFGKNNHTPVGSTETALGKAAKYFRWGGRVIMVVGVAIDVVSIVQASKPLKRATEVVAGWAGAWAGCKVVGAGLGAVGTLIEPGGGTAIGGVSGCIIGGIGGYFVGSTIAGEVYDWAEDTFFTPLPEVRKP